MKRVALTSAILLTSGLAHAQLDVNPPLPNVLILLDTSGSMENMLDNGTPESENASCSFAYTGGTIGSVTVANAATAVTGTSPNKWGIAMQALTGTMTPFYNCVSMPRDAASWLVQEYSIDGNKPYDQGYVLPYHRPAIGTDLNLDSTSACVVAPGWLPGDLTGGVGNPPKGCSAGGAGACVAGAGGAAIDFPAGAITTRWLNGTAGTCAFNQFQDGVLDSARDMLRFSLMTYDNDPAAGIGVTTPGMVVTGTPSTPFDGQWSYFPGWNGMGGGANPAQGKPADCGSLSVFELGSRNPAAPPWEGRLVMFPPPAATIAQVEGQNAQIQQALNALRMYGATPTAGMFADAQYYLQSDPQGPLQTDAYVQGGCREQYIIHITDGQPNEDLRPACANAAVDPSKPGVCPYLLPEQTAFQLANSPRPVKTFVIGFAISQISGVDCHTVTPMSSQCTGGDPKFSACCELQKIAYNGGTGAAYFADTAGDLNKALGAIIATIANQTTTRAVPAYAPAVSSNSTLTTTGTNSSLYLSAFTPTPGKPWTGNVQRERFQCTFGGSTYTVPPPTIDTTAGDDFAYNLNLPGTQGNRQFRTVLATAVGTTYPSDGTIRMQITNPSLPGVHGNDNLGTQGGALVGVTPGNILTLPPAALNINGTSCPNMLNTEWLTTNACRDLALNFVMAQPSTDPMPDPTFQAFQPRTGSALGAIYHSTPAIIGPPSANLSDESYQAFASQAPALNRKTVLYTATVDGLLHAFDINVTNSTRTNGELWSFLPPGVLYGLLSEYPAANPLLLDGAPAVKDVVFDRAKGAGSLLLATNWHTALVAGFGQNHRGYYALDVTDPAPNTDLTKGPQFLWQLTSMPTYKGAAQTELFGQHSATPAITTVFADLDGTGAHEIGVAVLPGGSDGSATGTKCARDGSLPANDLEDTAFPARANVRCWAAAGQPVVGRSLTIARLDTGEILRVFGRKADLPAALIAANRVGTTDTLLDSPMTGVPVVYPNEPGAVAQKIFIGDADGTVWRFDLTDTNPQNWTGMLYLDAYNATVDTSATSWLEGQPIQISPVVALDNVGAVVVGIATGDQETFTNSGTNFLYSITEKPDTVANRLRASVNWYQQYTAGERVSGPMTIFDSVLYWATFTPSATASCSSGTPLIWGEHYEQAVDTSSPTARGKGGMPRLTNDTAQYIDPTVSDPTMIGKIIPGVSINATPACADTAGTATDQYTGTTHTLAQYVTPGSYSLFAQVGGKNTGGGGAATGTFSLQLPTPQTQAVVDSWAAIVE